MKPSIKLGRIAGVDVGFNWSLVVIAVLLAYELATGRFPAEAFGYSQATYDLAGALTSVLFLTAVLLHELSHALVARHEGLKVGGITLWIMGGVTTIEGQAPTPGAELRISGVGPLVSLLTGGLFALGHLIASDAHTGPLWLSIFGWLAWINIALAVFNILPAAPLDGGRVLHAVVWRGTHNNDRATRVASVAGMVFGGALAVGGLFEVERGDAIEGVWLLLVGWFLVSAARNEDMQGRVHHALDGVTAAEVMHPVMLAPGWLTVQAFGEQYALTRPGAVFMLEQWGGNTPGYAGVITSEQLATILPQARSSIRVADIATPMDQVVYGKPTDAVLDLLVKMEGQRPALIVDGQHTVGGVLASDLERIVRGDTQAGRQPVH